MHALYFFETGGVMQKAVSVFWKLLWWVPILAIESEDSSQDYVGETCILMIMGVVLPGCIMFVLSMIFCGHLFYTLIGGILTYLCIGVISHLLLKSHWGHGIIA